MIKKFNDYINEDFTDLYNRWKKKEVRKEDKTNAIAVDLGLPSGLLWADRNVDASTVIEIGNYFSWGELNTKKEDKFNFENYKFYKVDNDFSKYNDRDNKKILDDCDDVAHYKMGNNWRIPTKKEFEELFLHTKQSFTIENRQYILKLQSKHNDNYIIIPTNGFVYDGLITGEFSTIYLWTSELSEDTIFSSTIFSYLEKNIDLKYLGRYCGAGVRGVYDKK